MLKTVLLEEMTSPQIRAAIDAGYDTAIVCAGAIEQHGRHLPIGMDAMDGKLFAVRIAEELGNALAAPVIRPGCSDHHMAFAGTISISVSLLQDLCRAYCRCLSHHGFKKIALITAHGGNIEAMMAVAPEIDAELPCKVVFANTLRDPRSQAATLPILEKYGITLHEGGIHSGFIETAILLASDEYGPLVDMAAAQRGFVGDARTKVTELKAKGPWNIADLSPIGTLGDPTEATAEAGREIFDALVRADVEIVREALES